GVGTAPRGARVDDRDHAVTRGQLDPLPDGVDDAGRVHAGHPRWLEAVGASPLAQHGVGGVDGGRDDGDPQLAGPGLRKGQVEDLQLLRSAGRGDSDDSHLLTLGRRRCPRPPGAQSPSSSGLVSRAWVAALVRSGSGLVARDMSVLRTVAPTTASSLPSSIAAIPSRATSTGSSLLSLRPTRVSSMPARAKNSVSVGPGIIV